jgi:ribonucleoside-diphosphate reductase alpha chain
MTVKNELNVIKKNGTREKFDPNKIHRILEWAIDGYVGVSVSEIELNAELKYKDGITTTDLHRALIESAKDLISLNSPNYQYVAARLLLYLLRKNVWGRTIIFGIYPKDGGWGVLRFLHFRKIYRR